MKIYGATAGAQHQACKDVKSCAKHKAVKARPEVEAVKAGALHQGFGRSTRVLRTEGGLPPSIRGGLAPPAFGGFGRSTRVLRTEGGLPPQRYLLACPPSFISVLRPLRPHRNRGSVAREADQKSSKLKSSKLKSGGAGPRSEPKNWRSGPKHSICGVAGGARVTGEFESRSPGASPFVFGRSLSVSTS